MSDKPIQYAIMENGKHVGSAYVEGDGLDANDVEEVRALITKLAKKHAR